MRKVILLAALLFPAVGFAQTSNDDEALLVKTRALYDTPFRHGLINFDCAVGFDFKQHVTDNFGILPETASPLIKLLQPIHYRVFVDVSGATVSGQPKPSDLSSQPQAASLEESNRSLLQIGMSNWVPHAYGELLPLGPTKFHFEKTTEGYKLTMNGEDVSAILGLDRDLHLLNGAIEKPMHIDLTTNFVSGPNGLLLAATTVNTNHMGIASFRYTYQDVDGFQLPLKVTLSSEQNQSWNYTLTDCKTQHGVVVQVGPPIPDKK